MVTLSLRSHVSKRQPSKALVLSFHGETGVGKNYVAQFVAESLYAKGLDSKFVHLFIATVDFPDDEKLDEYKLQLQDWIRGNVSQCAQTLFIFDEVDKMPVGMIDGICRVWELSRRELVQRWRIRNSRPYGYGAKGRPSVDAV